MNAEQVTWLRRATGAKIMMPLDLLPEPIGAKGQTLTTQEIEDKKKEAQAKDAVREDLRRQLAEQQRQEEARKQFLIANAGRLIEPLKPALLEALDIGYSGEKTVKTMGIKRTKKDKRDFIAKDGDLTQSGDVTEMRNAKLTKKGEVVDGPVSDEDAKQGLKATDKVFLELERAYAVLRGIRDELGAETVERMQPNAEGTALEKGPKVKLFSPDEIISEVFDPLVRSKILPDAFIEDAYSRTQMMLDATTAMYKKDLTDPSRCVSRGLGDMGKGFVDMAAGFAKCALEASGTSGVRVDSILKGSQELAKLSIDAIDTLDTAINHRALNRGDLKKLLDQIPDLAGQAVGAATQSKDIKAIVTDSTKAAELLIVAATNRNYDDASKAIGEFMANAGKAVLDGLNTKGGSEDDKNNRAMAKNAAFDLFGKMMSNGAPGIAKLVVQGKFSAARGQMARLLLDSASQIGPILSGAAKLGGAKDNDVTGMASGLTKGKTQYEQYPDEKSMKDLPEEEKKKIERERELEKARNEDLGEGQSDKAKESRTRMGESLDKLSEGDEEDTPERPKTKAELELAALRQKFDQETQVQARDEMEADAETELEDFKARLRGDDKVSRAQHTVEKMIADLQRDEAILSTLAAIGQAGAAVAGQFVSYAALGTEMIALAQNAKLAVEKAAATYSFLQEQKSARETANRYGSAIDNFLANAKFQLTAASLNAAMNGMKLIVAAVAAAVPHAAPAVPAMAAVSAGVNMVLGGIKQSRLKKAWDQTKKALENPANRRLGMEVRKLNPTLAKYTVAYGATEEEDPIAISMALACGLNEETLKNPQTNADKVKRYFETKFPDDGTVIGYWEDATDWTKGLPEPALTPVALGQVYKVLGENFGTFKAAPPGPLAAMTIAVSKPMPDQATAEDWMRRSEQLRSLDEAFMTAGGEAGKSTGSPKVAPIFAAFADLAVDAAFDAWTKAQPPPKTK